MYEWHSVRMRRAGRRGQLLVNDQSAAEGVARGGFTQLNLYQDLFLGGHPDIDELHGELNVSGGFQGCIQRVCDVTSACSYSLFFACLHR